MAIQTTVNNTRQGAMFGAPVLLDAEKSITRAQRDLMATYTQDEVRPWGQIYKHRNLGRTTQSPTKDSTFPIPQPIEALNG